MNAVRTRLNVGSCDARESRHGAWGGVYRLILAWAMVAMSVAGCARETVVTPNLLLMEGAEAYAAVPQSQRTVPVRVLYVTDRAAAPSQDKGLAYGWKRSQSLDYGITEVNLGDAKDWEQLVATSTRRSRDNDQTIQMASIQKHGSLFELGEVFVQPDGMIALTPETIARNREDEGRFREFISREMARASSGEVVVAVHGFNNDFEWSMGTAAQLGHFMSRRPVVVSYSWPAGAAGLLRGYTYDRESSEFTVAHFRDTVRLLASCPEVKRIHIVAHSRGTDVASSAIRELQLEARGTGRRVADAFKIETLVLAAPDLDWDVFRQRFMNEMAFAGPRRMIVYVSRHDSALGAADLLFGSVRRLGQLIGADIRPERRHVLKKLTTIQVISCEVSGFSTSHDYFYADPSVFSDLILALRDGRMPGAEHGRPLQRGEDGFWQITNGYPLKSKPRNEYP